MGRIFATIMLSVSVLGLTLSGCGRKYRLDPELIGEEGTWAVSRGSAAQTGGSSGSEFNGQLHLLWSNGSSGKPGGPLSIYYGELVYPDTKKKIKFYNLQTGKYLGRLKARGVPQTGVAVSDSLAFWGVAPRREGFYGHNLVTYRRQWEAHVKDVHPGPIISNNRLVVSSGDRLVLALDLETGNPVWTFQADQRLTASASLGFGKVFQPADQGWLYALSADSGRELYRVQLGGPIVSPAAVADRVYATVMTGRVYALDADDGSTVWSTDLGQPTWTSPTVADGRIYVGSSTGQVVALDASSGSVLWRYDAGTVIRSSALALGDYLVTGTMTGKLIVLKSDDGVLADSTTLKGPIKVSPVTDGRRLLIATEAGKIYCFGESDEQADRPHKRVNAQLQSQ